MLRKYHNKVAVATYAAILASAASFAAQFAYEGWEPMGIEPLRSPIGITAIIMFVVAIVLFIWNLRREELTHEQWLELRSRRQPDLAKLRSAIGAYVRDTFRCAKNPMLYNLREGYGYAAMPDAAVLFKDIGIDNTRYARLTNEELGAARMELQEIASRLANKEIRKKIQQLFRRTHIARSYQIFLKIYREQYEASPPIERYILRVEYRGSLAEYISKLYDYISIMERGEDLE